MSNYNTAIPEEESSYFDGGYWAYIGYSILVGFVTVITLGIAFPWMCCLLQRWKAKHTVICGKRMYFDGTGLQLLGNYLLWWFLSLITLGIYGLWLSINIRKWVAKHTHYESEADNNSYFDGGVLGMIGTSLLAGLVMLIPFVGPAWSSIIQLRWEYHHTVIDSRRHIFVGTVGSLFLKTLLWGFLTIITLGIFALFVPVKLLRWQTEGRIDNEHTTQALMARSEYHAKVHTDAAAFKTYRVEDDMECVKAGITDTMPEQELLALANSGVRSAQYTYAVRYSQGQYTQEPYSGYLRKAAEAEYAPAMSLYLQTHAVDQETCQPMLTKAAHRGQIWAVKAKMAATAQAALTRKEDKNALPALKQAVYYGDLLKESQESLTDQEAGLLQKCEFAIRRIQSQKEPSSVGKVIAAVIGVVLGLSIVIALIGLLIGRLAIDRPWSVNGGINSAHNDQAQDFATSSQTPAETSDFWDRFTRQMAVDHCELTMVDTATDGTVKYELTCSYYFWNSLHYVEVLHNAGQLERLSLSGVRIYEPDSPDPTLNEMQWSSIVRVIYKELGLGDYDGITPNTATGTYTETYGPWTFCYENTDQDVRLTVSKN